MLSSKPRRKSRLINAIDFGFGQPSGPHTRFHQWSSKNRKGRNILGMEHLRQVASGEHARKLVSFLSRKTIAHSLEALHALAPNSVKVFNSNMTLASIVDFSQPYQTRPYFEAIFRVLAPNGRMHLTVEDYASADPVALDLLSTARLPELKKDLERVGFVVDQIRALVLGELLTHYEQKLYDKTFKDGAKLAIYKITAIKRVKPK